VLAPRKEAGQVGESKERTHTFNQRMKQLYKTAMWLVRAKHRLARASDIEGSRNGCGCCNVGGHHWGAPLRR
jgi:hypothetical protein